MTILIATWMQVDTSVRSTGVDHTLEYP